MLQTVIVVAIVVVAVAYLAWVYWKKRNKPCGPGCAVCGAKRPGEQGECLCVELEDTDAHKKEKEGKE